MRSVLAIGLTACAPTIDVSTGAGGSTAEILGNPTESTAEQETEHGEAPEEADSSGTSDDVWPWCVLVGRPASTGIGDQFSFHDNDLDDRLELWVVDGVVEPRLRRFLMERDRSFTELEESQAAGTFELWGDVDGDGRLDAFTWIDPPGFTVFLADRTGAIGSRSLPVVGADQDPSLLADMTGDGLGDLLGFGYDAVENFPFLRVQPGAGDGTFASGSLLELADSQDVSVVHRLAEPDALVVQYGTWCDVCDVSPLYMSVLLVGPGGEITESRRTDAPQQHDYLQGIDHSGDGEVDVLVHDHPSGDVAWLVADGTGFAEEVVATYAGHEVVGRDFDLDGDVDLLLEGPGGRSVCWGEPDGFGDPEPVLAADLHHDLCGDTRGDLDGDGYLDVVGWLDGPVVWTLVPCA